METYKEQILELNKQGKTRKEIAEIVGCGESIISYHLNDKSRERAISRQIKKRFLLIDSLRVAKGGKCEICGYSRCFAALEFHHIIPEEKSFGICKKKISNPELLVKEANKCIMLCSNCHREIHANIITLDNYNPKIITSEELFKIKEDYSKDLVEFPKPEHYAKGRISPQRYCGCGKLKSDSRQTGCPDCLMKERRKLWPTKEKLEELIWNYLIIEVAEMYNVSELSVQQWIRAYDIKKPKKGYSKALKEKRKRLSIVSKEKFEELIAKHNNTEVSKILGIKYGMVMRLRKDFGLETS